MSGDIENRPGSQTANSSDQTTFADPEDGSIHEAELTREKSHISVAESLPAWREALFVAVISSTQFATQYGLGQCLSILHVIGEDLGITNPGELGWIIAGYSLTVGTFILVSGRLGDLFGFKRLLIAGFFWYALWSLVAGLSIYSGKVLFIFARVFQGVGAAILLPNALGLLGRTYPPGKRKNMVFAIFGATAPVGSIVGSCISALFALTYWPWVFWSMAIVLVMLGLLAIVVIPDVEPDNTMRMSLKEKLVALDPLGAVVGVTALILINISWNQAPAVGWSQPYIYVILIIGVLVLAAFFFIEARLSRNPLVPFKALTGDVAWILACIACGWGCFGISIFYLWQYVEVIRGVSPLLGTAWTCPLAISGVCAAITTGKVLHRLGPSLTLVIALCAFFVGSALIALAPRDQIYWGQTFFCTLVLAWGMDMSFPAATVIISDSLPRDQQGMGQSLVNTVVNYSISLGLGFASTVEIYVNNGGSTTEDVFRGYKGALLMGVGLAGLGIVISSMFFVKSRMNKSF